MHLYRYVRLSSSTVQEGRIRRKELSDGTNNRLRKSSGKASSATNPSRRNTAVPSIVRVVNPALSMSAVIDQRVESKIFVYAVVASSTEKLRKIVLSPRTS